MEVRNGVEYHWVTTVEHKTLEDKVDYLVPAVTIGALEISCQYAKPLQARLAGEIEMLEMAVPDMPERERLIRLDKAKRDSKEIIFMHFGGERKAGSMLCPTPVPVRRFGCWRSQPESTGLCNHTNAGAHTPARSSSPEWDAHRLFF